MVKPFGMLFEEEIPEGIVPINAVYDSEAQISFSLDEQGKKTPFVTLGFVVMGATGTGTSTRVAADKEDTDPHNQPLRSMTTQSVTKIRAETSDPD